MEPDWYAFKAHEYVGRLAICPVAIPFARRCHGDQAAAGALPTLVSSRGFLSVTLTGATSTINGAIPARRSRLSVT